MRCQRTIYLTLLCCLSLTASRRSIAADGPWFVQHLPQHTAALIEVNLASLIESGDLNSLLEQSGLPENKTLNSKNARWQAPIARDYFKNQIANLLASAEGSDIANVVVGVTWNEREFDLRRFVIVRVIEKSKSANPASNAAKQLSVRQGLDGVFGFPKDMLGAFLPDLEQIATSKTDNGTVYYFEDPSTPTGERGPKIVWDKKLPTLKAEQLSQCFTALDAVPIRAGFVVTADQQRALREMLPAFNGLSNAMDGKTVANGFQAASFGLHLAPLRIDVLAHAESGRAADQFAVALQEMHTAVKKLFPEQYALLVGDDGPIEVSRPDDTAFTRIALHPLRMTAVRAMLQELSAKDLYRLRNPHLNQLKFIALGLHNYYDKYKTLPPAVIRTPDGTPLYSWRVAILPFLDQQKLYEDFHLNEPWNSEHNLKLLPRMPDVYAVPQIPPKPGATPFLAVTGKNTMFGQRDGVKFEDVEDGTANTIAVVTVVPSAVVPWTKPDDWEFDPQLPFRDLITKERSVFSAAFTDGSARKITEDQYKHPERLFLINDGNLLE
ncbi:DUF1559 family PulG-like putative transporter [Stratiformator vulcanicus]|uniref:DUF1559 domain-containing protein n=1 Tax=Stratiformator vulcanicus TaxID=2527980 RepID=A0A517R1D5_9PLAN|nr:DUF1559 domain-containing protein [Stratiformator vulcanicus]QDT37650.1 hypothetical protein Pan189_20300 [Stratiformator vulcanicus]